MPPLARLVESRLKALRRQPRRAEHLPEGRLPPGQRLAKGFPVLDLGARPRIPKEVWRLRVHGLVEAPLTLDWDAFQALPQAERVADIHCVTRWSRLDVPWRGVPARELLARARPLPEARHVLLSSSDGYATNLPLEALLDDDVLFAHSVDGAPLAPEHGAPVRLVVPKRYFWKSAKWVTRVELLAQDRPGFWEERGYHNDGDPWREERYRSQRRHGDAGETGGPGDA
jgi:DMSO/TMAO reductase YedYZ molybdopterin-dependent catalytic subunit